ncbi:dihydropteroate synthase [Siccirubricoccus deserti]
MAGAAAPITAALPRFAGLVPRLPGGPLVMGIVNVTPDSFSGDGVEAEAAILRGRALLEAGADILDIGGESTRPGAAPVAPEEEIRRILPVVRALAPLAPVSIDTRNAATMAAALAAGASIINDIAALRHDPDAPRVVAEAGASVVLMHMLGTDPRTMQADPRYADVALEVLYFLRDRIQALGLPPERVAMDPGIGFGKTLAHNLMLLDRLPLLAGLGCPIWSAPPARPRSAGWAGWRRPGSVSPPAWPPPWPPPPAAPPSSGCMTWRRRCRRCGSGWRPPRFRCENASLTAVLMDLAVRWRYSIHPATSDDRSAMNAAAPR